MPGIRKASFFYLAAVFLCITTLLPCQANYVEIGCMSSYVQQLSTRWDTKLTRQINRCYTASCLNMRPTDVVLATVVYSCETGTTAAQVAQVVDQLVEQCLLLVDKHRVSD